jgi:hypothetical protein
MYYAYGSPTMPARMNVERPYLGALTRNAKRCHDVWPWAENPDGLRVGTQAGAYALSLRRLSEVRTHA